MAAYLQVAAQGVGDWNIKRAQTADVDLNYPQTFWEKVGYGIVGWFALKIID